MQKYVTEQRCEWKFNPHASHFVGVWEWQIGTIRRVLNAMLRNIGAAQAEVSSIVNNRPITVVSADAEEPVPLSPSMLLTIIY